ncbi:sialidase family protein [Actinopolymorpha sp. B9G3]|uniref:sialidase family protein n=1 Tax=Actinopolymorpha sp. B9G3 TaxID=3158970 RepID=UPI0032D8C737
MRGYSHRQRSARVAASLIATGLVAAFVGVTAMDPLGSSTSAHAGVTEGVSYTTVFSRGQDGYHTFRIPAVLKAADGTLLAFAEGRVNSPSDDGNIDLVLKRSTDGGVTWGPLQVLVDDGPDRFANPVPILDRRTGRIVVNTTRTGGNVTTADVRCGRVTDEETRRSFILHSDDNGATWSRPNEITADVKPATWRHFVGGPGHGIQLTSGEHAGRLVIPGNHSVAPPEGSGIDCLDERLFGAHSLYSDDGGTTWNLGGVDTSLQDVYNPNESTAVELNDGTVYFNARDQGGTSPGRRVSTTSSDGAASFDAPYQATSDIVTTQIQGSVLKLSQAAESRSRIVFSAPAHPTARENLTLWSSFDQTASWQRGLQLYDGPSGYSDLVSIDGQTLGVLFENGDRLSPDATLPYHQRISFARVPVGMLDVPSPPRQTTPDESGHGHDGLISGSPKPVEGAFGSALELAGDYVEAPLSDSLAVGGGSFTAAAWFRTSASDDQAIVWAHSTTSGEPKWWIRLEPNLGRLRALLETGDASRSVTAPGEYADGTWHHVALTRDSDNVTLFVDGSPVATAAAITGSVSDGARTGIRFGARVDGINNPLRGAVDEAWLFDRALTAAEIQALADDNAAPPDGALLHLPMDNLRRAGVDQTR